MDFADDALTLQTEFVNTPLDGDIVEGGRLLLAFNEIEMSVGRDSIPG